MSLDERDYMQDRAHERFYRPDEEKQQRLEQAKGRFERFLNGPQRQPISRSPNREPEPEDFSGEWRRIGFVVLAIIIGAYLIKKLGLLALIFR